MRRRCFFLFFLISGFCARVEDLGWLRLAMAQHGRTAALVSVVVSVCLAGFALGSWRGGRLAGGGRGGGLTRARALRLYAAAELLLATSAYVVPPLLRLGREALMTGTAAATWGETRYLVASGACLTMVLLPFCFVRGATFPLAMAALREDREEPSPGTFGHLYAAAFLGAACGSLAQPFLLVEVLGFGKTLVLASALHIGVVATALLLSLRASDGPAGVAATGMRPEESPAGAADAVARWLLFATGFTGLGMQAIAVRQFAPYLGTSVYASATLVTLCLAATFVGAMVHRRRLRSCAGSEGEGRPTAAWIAAGSAGFLALVAADPRLPLPTMMDPAGPLGLFIGALRVLAGPVLFCGLLGYITPRLIDRVSSGDPTKAGRAYAAHILGCLLGPLAVLFVLVPWIGERGATVAVSLGMLAMTPLAARAPAAGADDHGPRGRIPVLGFAAACAAGLILALSTRDYATLFETRQVRRDDEATVIAIEKDGRKELLVDGVANAPGTAVARTMAHLPMSLLDSPPKSVLLIGFGSGTTLLSALSWDTPTTVVELVPSVPAFFGDLHPDGPDLPSSPLAHVVIDDGRRFLERTRESYDVVIVVPPSPIDAAGSGLLYSREFYASVRKRLRPGGLLEQWHPGGDQVAGVSVARALLESFPEVRAFRALEGRGIHFLACDRTIPEASAPMLAARLPAAAAADLVQGKAGLNPIQAFLWIVSREIPADKLLAIPPVVPALSDDRPVSEYGLLRRLAARDEPER